MREILDKEVLRKELIDFAKILVDGYVDDTTILEILGDSSAIDDYIDNQLKERWLIKQFTCRTCGTHEKVWNRKNDDWYCKVCGHICR